MIVGKIVSMAVLGVLWRGFDVYQVSVILVNCVAWSRYR